MSCRVLTGFFGVQAEGSSGAWFSASVSWLAASAKRATMKRRCMWGSGTVDTEAIVPHAQGVLCRSGDPFLTSCRILSPRCKRPNCRATKRGERDHATAPGLMPGIERKLNHGRRDTMNLKQATRAMTFSALLGIAALSSPVFAADGDAMATRAEIMKMANKDGLISKKDFMTMMEKKFDEMDKARKGMLPVDDVMKIYGRSDKGQ